MAEQVPGVLLDVDGTLLDTTHLHALAWWRALRSLGHTVPMSRIHGLVGMGGDRLVPELLGRDLDGASDAQSREFDRFDDEITLPPGARELVIGLAATGFAVVLSSSASTDDLERFRRILDVDDHLVGATHAGDVDSTKPDPEVFDIAVERHGLDPNRTTVVGDTIWDGLAARRADLAFLGVTTGGSSHDALVGAGARAVYRDLNQLVDELDRAPFA